jgi:hypothetical protein
MRLRLVVSKEYPIMNPRQENGGFTVRPLAVFPGNDYNESATEMTLPEK